MDTESIFRAVADFSQLAAATQLQIAQLAELATAFDAAGAAGQIEMKGLATTSEATTLKMAATSVASHEAEVGFQGVGAAAREGAAKLEEINRSAEGVSSTMGGVGVIASKGFALGLAAVGAAALKMGTEFLAEKEQQQVAFTALLKNGAQAKQLIIDLEDTARFMPFASETLTNAVRQMLVMGIPLEKLLQGTGKEAKGLVIDIGDAAAAQGPRAAEAFSQISAVIGRISSTGRVSEREMRALALAGVPVREILAKELHLTSVQMDHLATAGVSSIQVIDALGRGFHDKFGGTMAKEAQTLNGLMTTLKDNLKIFLGTLEQGAFNALKATIDGVTQAFTNLDTEIAAAGGFFEFLKAKVPIVYELFQQLQFAFDSVGHAISSVLPIVENFAKAFAGVWIVAVTLALHALGDVLQWIADGINAIPPTFQEVIGLTLGLVVALKTLKELEIWTKLITGAKAFIDHLQQVWTGTKAQEAADLTAAKATIARADAQAALAVGETRVTEALAAKGAAESRLLAAETRLAELRASTATPRAVLLKAEEEEGVAVNQLAEAKARLFVAEQRQVAGAAAATTAVEAETVATGEATAVTAGFGAVLDIVLSPLVLIAAAIGAVVLAFKLYNDQQDASAKATLHFSEASDTLAKSLGYEIKPGADKAAGATNNLTDAMNQAAAAAAHFNVVNHDLLVSLGKMTDEQARAAVIQIGVDLTRKGFSKEEVKKSIDELLKALGNSNIQIPVNMDFSQPSANLDAFATQAKQQATAVAKDWSNAWQWTKDGFGPKIGSTTRENIHQLGDEIQRTFAKGQFQDGFEMLSKFNEALTAAHAPAEAINSAMASLVGRLSTKGSIFEGLDMGTFKNDMIAGASATQALLNQLQNLKSHIGPADMQPYIHQLDDLLAKGVPLADALDQVNKAMEAQRNAAQRAATGVAALNQEFTTGQVDAKAYDTSVAALQKTMETMSSLSTTYTDVMKEAQKADQDQAQAKADAVNAANASTTASGKAMTAEMKKQMAEQNKIAEQGLRGDILALNQKHDQELKALQNSGQANTTNLQIMRDRQAAENRAADAALGARVAEDKATAQMATNTGSQLKTAKAKWEDYTNGVVVNLQTVADALKKKLDDMEQFTAHNTEIARKWGQDIADAAAKMDPSGALSAKLAAGGPGDQALVDQIHRQAKLVSDTSVQDIVKTNEIIHALAEDHGKSTAKEIGQRLHDAGMINITEQDIIDVAAKSADATVRAWAAQQSLFASAGKTAADDLMQGFLAGLPAFTAIVAQYTNAIVAGMHPHIVIDVTTGQPKVVTDADIAAANTLNRTLRHAGESPLDPLASRTPTTSSLPSSTPSDMNPYLTHHGAQLFGSILSYASGHLPTSAVIQPAVGPSGLIQWAEPGTGDEAFIPLGGQQTDRSKAIWMEAGKRLGVKGLSFIDALQSPSFDTGGFRAPRNSQTFASGGVSAPASGYQGPDTTETHSHLHLDQVVVQTNDPHLFMSRVKAKARMDALTV